MSVYNSERYLAGVIDRIVRQTVSDFAFLIINDGFTDGSRHILEACTDTRIRRIDNERKLGLSASLNRGFAKAKGVYVLRMDADDIALPDRLAKQVAFMERSPHIDVSGSWYEMFGDRSRVVKTHADHQDIRDTFFSRTASPNRPSACASKALRTVRDPITKPTCTPRIMSSGAGRLTA